MNDPVLLMTFAFLLPLVPAYILYRMLPSATKVGGPFKGLDLQLSGAFAGYFLLVVMAFSFLYSRKPVATDELWLVSGQIECKSHSLSDVRINLAGYNPIGDGTFTIRVPVSRSISGEITFPTLVIEDTGHEPAYIHLDEDAPKFGQQFWKLSKHPESKAIKVLDVISLKSLSYQPNGGAPQQVAPPSGSEVAP